MFAEGSEGSMRDAQSIFDQVISYAGTSIKDSDIEALLGFEHPEAHRDFKWDLSRALSVRADGTILVATENMAKLAKRNGVKGSLENKKSSTTI